MRTIVQADALEWLVSNRDVGSIVTSLPDMEEIGLLSVDAKVYADWFWRAATECFHSVSKGYPVIFYQTDRLVKGRRFSKAFNLMSVAEEWEYGLVWHKIVLRRDPGKTDLRRPGYSHMVCFGDKTVKPGKPTPDVMHCGKVLYPNGMSITAATAALRAALKHGPAVCDPFCGRGTVPALAEVMGFERVTGVDIDEKQCAAAKALRLFKGEHKRNRL